MNTDIRLLLSFQHHPKTKKLRYKLGNDAVLSFIWLMMFAAANKTDGVLSGMDHEDIALAADWGGDPDEYVAVLVAVKYLDFDGETYCIHDFEINNPWVAGAEQRSDHARKAANARHKAATGRKNTTTENQQLTPKNHAQSTGEQCGEHAASTDEHALRNAPSPSPSPIPSPLPSPKPSLLNSGGEFDASNVREEEKTRPPLKIERQKWDYSDFKPEESTVGRIRQDNPGITDAFIDGRINEFVTYAEGHYRPDQLQSKFISSVNSDFKRQLLNGHRTRAEAKLKIPTDVNQVMDWARKNSYPEPGVGESMDAYKTRIERNLVERQREAYA